MSGLKLHKITFEVLENNLNSALCSEELGIFTEEGTTACKKIQDYLHEMGPVMMYLGWDGNVYPQFKVERVDFR
jgi:hypothetical protein